MKKEKEEKRFLTIGKLVEKLRIKNPEVTNSKLRFLEAKGLITPARSSNKYREYNIEDIKKISFILKMQKDFYMPLNIIKEKLKSKQYREFLDEGKDFKNLQLRLGEELKSDYKPKAFSMDDLKKKFKISPASLAELAENRMLDWREENGKYLIQNEDIEIIKMYSELSKYGIRVKHLKIFENFAGRHSSFIQQIVLPLLLSSNKQSHKRALRVTKILERDLCDFHELLLIKENRKFLEKHK